jgi:hypothetical protein
MKRPFADKRPIGPIFPFKQRSYSSNTANGNLLEPTTELVDPRTFSRKELKKSARMYALFHEHMAKSIFKYNFSISADRNENLPEPHYAETEIYNTRPLYTVIPEEEDPETVPTLTLEISDIHLFGSAAEGNLGIREPSSVHRKAKKIADEVARLDYPARYEVPFSTNNIKVENWESKQIGEKKKLAEDFLKKIYPIIEDTVTVDLIGKTTKLWLYNLMYSDIDFIMSYKNVGKPGRSEFIDFIASYNDNGRTITKMSLISGELVETMPHPQDSLLVGDETSVPDGLPSSIKSNMNNTPSIGAPTQSERNRFVSMWKQFVDMWKGDSQYMEVTGNLKSSFRTSSDSVLSEKEITGEIPVVADIEPRYL